MGFIAYLLNLAIDIFMIAIILHVAVSWLIAFGVLNTANPQARNLVALLQKITDPVMRPVQKYIPPLGGIDVTPIVVIIGLQVLKGVVNRLLLGGY